MQDLGVGNVFHPGFELWIYRISDRGITCWAILLDNDNNE